MAKPLSGKRHNHWVERCSRLFCSLAGEVSQVASPPTPATDPSLSSRQLIGALSHREPDLCRIPAAEAGALIRVRGRAPACPCALSADIKQSFKSVFRWRTRLPPSPFNQSLPQVFLAWIIAPVLSSAFAAIIFLLTKYGVLLRSNPTNKGLMLIPIYFWSLPRLLSCFLLGKVVTMMSS